MNDERRRLTRAAAAVLARYGHAELTVEHVLDEAGASRAVFDENFDGTRGCLLVAQEEAFDRLVAELFRACAGEDSWPDQVAAAVRATIAFAQLAPERARLLIVDAVAVDPALAERALASHDCLVGFLRHGRERAPVAASLPELTERALVGAAASVIGSRLLSNRADCLPDLEPELVQLMLMPYVSVEEARRIAAADR